MQCLRVDKLHVAGRVYVSGQGREHDHAENRGNKHADAERPKQFGAENSALVPFNWLLSHGLGHPTSREEDEQIDRQIADHQQGDGDSGYNTGSERHDAHDLGQRGFIDLSGDFRRNVGSGSLISSDHRPAPHRAPANVLDAEFYTEVVKRPATSRKPMIVPVQYNAWRLFTAIASALSERTHCHAGLEGGRIALRIEAQA